MAKVVNVVVGAAALAVGLAAGGAFAPLIMAGASMLFSSAVGMLLTPKPKPRDASATMLQIGEVPREALFGEAATPGGLVDAFNYGGKYGTDWEVLILAVADHRCAGLSGFFVDDKYHAFSADGAVAGFNNQLMVWWRDGRAGQTVPSVVTGNGPGWSGGGAWGKSVAYVVVAYKADDPEAKKPTWPGSRPRFLWVVKGKLCYDPRKDGTLAGGSGAHRWSDPATWEWTDNLIVCRYNWSRGIYALDQVGDPAALLVGRGLTAEEQPPEKAFAPANLCDELVGAEKRYRADGRIAATMAFVDVEEQFAAACGGTIVTREGSVEIEPGQGKAASFFFTDDDLIVGSEVDWNEAIPSAADRDWVNTVIPRYVEPAQKWADHAAPVRREPADVIADGGSREETLSLALVRHAAQAGRVGEIRRRLGRLWGRGAVTLGPRFAEVEEGDIGVWTSPRRFGGASRTFRVESYAIGREWHNRLALREINASVYSDGAFIADQSATDQGAAPPEIGQPGVGAWTLTAEQLSVGGAAVPALVIAGATDDPRAREVRFEYWKSPGGTAPGVAAEWIDLALLGPSVKRREIASVAPGAVYYAAVTYLVDGVPGDRRVLGPVTALAPVVEIDDVAALAPVVEKVATIARGATANVTLVPVSTGAATADLTISGGDAALAAHSGEWTDSVRTRESSLSGVRLGGFMLGTGRLSLTADPDNNSLTAPIASWSRNEGANTISALKPGGEVLLTITGHATDATFPEIDYDRHNIRWLLDGAVKAELAHATAAALFGKAQFQFSTNAGGGFKGITLQPANDARYSALADDQGTQPENNATVGSTIALNTKDVGGAVLGADDLKNANLSLTNTIDVNGKVVAKLRRGTTEYGDVTLHDNVQNKAIGVQGRRIVGIGAGDGTYVDNSSLGISTGGQLTYLDASGNPINIGAVTYGGLGGKALGQMDTISLGDAKITDKTATNIAYSGGGTVESLKPAEAGAEKTAGKSLTVLEDRVADNIAEGTSRKWAAESGATKNAPGRAINENSDFSTGDLTRWVVGRDGTNSPTISLNDAFSTRGPHAAVLGTFHILDTLPAPATAGERWFLPFRFATVANNAGGDGPKWAIGMEFLDGNGAYISGSYPYQHVAITVAEGPKSGVHSATAPAGTKSVRAVMAGVFGGTGQGKLDYLEMHRDEPGATVGGTAGPGGNIVNDVTVPGSGAQLGDQRNLKPITTMNTGSRFIGSISWNGAAGDPATATISVGAGSMLIGSQSVSYNAMSAGVSGTGGSTVTFDLYVEDGGYAGGTRTLIATSDKTARFQGDDRAWIGDVTILFPTSGTGEGTGNPGGGGYDDMPL